MALPAFAINQGYTYRKCRISEEVFYDSVVSGKKFKVRLR
jgi:hypothetical protein